MECTPQSFPIDCPPLKNITKHVLLSDIAKTFDILGLFSIYNKIKILVVVGIESQVGWDDPIPTDIPRVWLRLRSESNILPEKIPRYFPSDANMVIFELHGFSDASERDYAGVVYFWMIHSERYMFLLTKVAPLTLSLNSMFEARCPSSLQIDTSCPTNLR